MHTQQYQTHRRRFAELHQSGTFVMPNAWDVGSARILESLGFEAIATTSSGFAASLGRMDQSIGLDELIEHVTALTRAVGIPLSVDAEHGYSDSPSGVAETVAVLAQAGASGVSIEDYIPGRGIIPVEAAVERVASAVTEAQRQGVTITARAENHLYDGDNLDDTVTRLLAYRDAGAHCVYAPGLDDLEAITRVVVETQAPVNVLLLDQGPSVSELAKAGVRRLSTGGALAFAAYGAMLAAARELLEQGSSTYVARSMQWEERVKAFGEEGN